MPRAPVADYWSFWLADPLIDPLQENIVALTPFDQTFANFPSTQVLGWGQRAMKLDQLPSAIDGRGIKVGIISLPCRPTTTLHGTARRWRRRISPASLHWCSRTIRISRERRHPTVSATRGASNVVQILRESAQPLALGDPTRTGAGLPDATVAGDGELAVRIVLRVSYAVR